MKKILAFSVLFVVNACSDPEVLGTAAPERNLTGPQGLQGEVGPQGIQGIQGEIGPVGLQGLQGIQGEIGLTGPQGIMGLTGNVGATGPIGSQGFQGIQGSKGDVGAQGQTGGIGPQGLVGEIGPQGDVGPQGIQGEAGSQGSVGIQGDRGFNGLHCWDLNQNDFCDLETEDIDLDGVCGVVDCRGHNGLNGRDGVPGQLGPPGLDGVNGKDGAPGQNGNPGLSGAPGQQGVKGDKGDPGISYNGNDHGIPSRVEYLESIVPVIHIISAIIPLGQKEGVVVCPAGEIAIGGGFDNSGIYQASKVVIQSMPSGNNGWKVKEIGNCEYQDCNPEFVIYVVCLSMVPS